MMKMKNSDYKKKVSQKISLVLKGRKLSDNTKRKLSYCSKGRTPWNKGLPSPYAKNLPQSFKNNPPVGSKNHNWVGGASKYRGIDWDSQKRIVLDRDRKTCRKCGITEGKLDAHHIIPYRISRHNQLWNLITLCSKCHMRAENNYRKIGMTNFTWKWVQENIIMERRFLAVRI